MIENYIPFGYENAVTIESLMKMTGLSNREVRREIAESDAIILNLQDGRGYFRMNPKSKGEKVFAEKYVAQEKSRGWNVLKKAFRIEKDLKRMKNRGQVYRLARLLVGYSLDELAEKLDITPIVLEMIEEGEIGPGEGFDEAFEEIVGLRV